MSSVQALQLRFYIHFSSLPCVLHATSILSFLIWSLQILYPISVASKSPSQCVKLCNVASSVFACEKLLVLSLNPPRLKDRLVSAVHDSLKICGNTQNSHDPKCVAIIVALVFSQNETRRALVPSTPNQCMRTVCGSDTVTLQWVGVQLSSSNGKRVCTYFKCRNLPISYNKELWLSEGRR
jgi:hypothetical protein